MICNNCNLDKIITDFVNNKNICYKCVYRIKIEKISVKRIERKQFCRICEKEVIHKIDVKKRQRTIFCSRECAALGHKDQINNHWTRKLIIETTIRKKG